jgi:hypothetical protein
VVRFAFTIRRVEPGTRVEVQSRFEQRWARGFEIAEQVRDGDTVRYRVRRRSDDSLLPVLFGDHEVREERRKNDMWWI